MNRAVAKYGGSGGGDPERELLKRHGPLLDRIARRLSARTGHAVQPEDLWSAGAMGLIEAARRFDAGRDVKFETFAEHRIRGAMIDEMRRMDHLPRRLRDDADQVERAHARLAQQLQREPTVEEVAEAVGAPLEDVMEVMQLLQPAVPMAEELAASEAPAADEAYGQHQRQRALAGAIAELPERLRILLALYYDEALTYREIARMLGVSEPRVCQLHGDAMKRLRGVFAEPG
ncbi:MAG: FliA/WhiG family RNA polymerase sigma factor [Anaeromyxobacter sp.]|nr:FliA/WhiG family RNA polymerase sigma factor [Anaeromyxobacter sp.]MBL0276169.1 FliA/WhiG family RNA polymerase sigma factor [Anaeromyxobacter sp.]